MDTKVIIEGNEISRHWLDANHAACQKLLSSSYKNNSRPLCLCKQGGVEMYIAQHSNGLVLCRMPDTGYLHDPLCDSFEPNRSLSGISWYTDQAIRVNGEYHLLNYPGASASKRDFVVSRTAAHPHAVSIKGILNLLLELTQFNHWSPAMEGKRSWGLLRHHLKKVASSVVLNQSDDLSKFLYIPQQFSIEKPHLNTREYVEYLKDVEKVDGYSQTRFLIGELKSVEPNPNRGYRVAIKNLHGVNFFLSDSGFEVLNKISRFVTVNIIEKPVRFLVILAVNKGKSSWPIINGIGLQMLSSDYIPVESTHDMDLVNRLIFEKRRFIKPMRFDMPDDAVLHNALLLDVGPEVRTMDILGETSKSNESATKKRSIERQIATGAQPWVWDIAIPLSRVPLPGKIRQKESAYA